MRQYEIAIRIAQVHHLAEERKYKKALTVIQTLDMRQVRNISDLKVFAEVYTRTEQFEAAKATYLRIYKKSRTRRILYRLIYLAIRTNELDDAESYYKEFVRMNPNNRDALILRYRIDKAAGVPISQLIDTLKSLKEEEYIEEWAYELAKLYQQAGRYEECAEECEDIKLWFGQGEIVERAKLLLEHIEEKNPLPFMDDKDFTVKTEKPNPDDTGSLPALNEYLEAGNEQEMKYLKKVDPAKFEETMVKTISEEEQESESEMDEQSASTESTEKSAEEESTDIWKPETPVESAATEEAQEIFSDAPVDAEPENIAMETASEPAKEPQEPRASQTTVTAQSADNKYSAINPADFPRISQSGTGITQDLAAEISAIYEAEQNEQLKEKGYEVSLCCYEAGDIDRRYRVRHYLSEVFKQKIFMKSGGFLYIEQTEAMAVIDVNTGKSIGKKNQETHIKKINLEAAKEAARQIRLRNLSGIIMIDFIDMRSKEDEKELLQVMQHYLNDDSKKAVAVDITKLGIMEITRKKEKNPIFRQISIDILE